MHKLHLAAGIYIDHYLTTAAISFLNEFLKVNKSSK